MGLREASSRRRSGWSPASVSAENGSGSPDAALARDGADPLGHGPGSPAGTGVRSCAQWLSWRCGLSRSTARDQLRVAHALEDLPVLRATFGRGELSYSKVRALVRVATPESEADLVDVATGCTANQLDRLCSGLARARSNEEVLEQAERARFTATWEPDGMLRFSGRLSAEDGAVLLAALSAQHAPAVTDPPAESVSAETPAAVDDVVPAPAADQVGHADGPTPDPAQRAAESDAAALVVLARHALANPPDAVSSAPVRLVVHTVTAPQRTGNESASAETPAAAPADPPTIGVLDAGPGIPLLPIGPDTLRRLACEALVEPATHADDDRPPRTQHRFATVRQRRALLRRDGGCAFPGCPRRRGLHAHHRLPWSEGGATAMHNLVLACEHHHRLLHEGGWHLRPNDNNCSHTWIATGPTGQIVPTAPPTEGAAEDLPAAHPSDVGGDTVTGHWRGERLDLDYAVGVLAPAM
ncbi:MAG TPA: DUF222 domain-containing protein [Mycobacteriales bacterium]